MAPAFDERTAANERLHGCHFSGNERSGGLLGNGAMAVQDRIDSQCTRPLKIRHGMIADVQNRFRFQGGTLQYLGEELTALLVEPQVGRCEKLVSGRWNAVGSEKFTQESCVMVCVGNEDNSLAGYYRLFIQAADGGTGSAKHPLDGFLSTSQSGNKFKRQPHKGTKDGVDFLQRDLAAANRLVELASSLILRFSPKLPNRGGPGILPPNGIGSFKV